MAYLGMTDQPEMEIPESRVYERSRWIRVSRRGGGFFFPEARLGKTVKKGDALGAVIDPLTDESHTVVSNVNGEIIGMAFSRPVLSGYALYHVAWHTDD
jgi:predicted deacylase